MENQIEMQKAVRDNAEEARSAFLDLQNWEKDVKAKEKELKLSHDIEHSQPIRSHVLKATSKQSERNEPSPKPDAKANPKQSSATVTDNKDAANKAKELGNEAVKKSAFKDAIKHYTDAISLYNKEPIFYSNRAQCHLKLNQFKECVEDCCNAIHLDDKSVKAYYRRMQAYEQLGEKAKAITDCARILEIDSKNMVAQKDFDRLMGRPAKSQTPILKTSQSLNKIQSTAISSKYFWSNYDDSVRDIDFITKAPHMRSKVPLKRMTIIESDGIEKRNQELESTKSKLMRQSIEQIPDDIVDNIFNNATGESSTSSGTTRQFNQNLSMAFGRGKQISPTKPLKKSTSLDASICNSTVQDENLRNKFKDDKSIDVLYNELKAGDSFIRPTCNNAEIEISNQTLDIIGHPPPKTSAEFYSTWRDLSFDSKYHYLKSIPIGDLNKVLGVNLESALLSEILHILKEYYVRDELNISDVLLEITKNKEMNIITMFLTEKDRTLLNDLLQYMRSRNENIKDIAVIEDKFVRSL